ncbi:transglutaminase-like domain-containing protein [Oscillospiraceae bacterium MB08-C2-2]|nr:transglutaminase-like domain-containing protein [Oscillospiraceae bacterium MB08-C2-2]
MRKKSLRLLILLLLPLCLTLWANAQAVGGILPYYSPGDIIRIEYSVQPEYGTLRMLVTGSQKDVSVRIAKENMEYLHHIVTEKEVEIPLTMGSGDYELAVRLYITSTKAEPLWEDTITVLLEDELAPYKSASRIVNWNEEMQLVKKAKFLSGEKNNAETALAICGFLVDNFTYKENAPPATYIPDLDQVFQNKGGICYDFAALYVAMCRAAGIPAQLVMGYSGYMKPDSYHAWCRVYLDGQWLPIDPTYSIQTGNLAFLEPSKLIPQKTY